MNLTIETAKGRHVLTITGAERAARLSDLLRKKHFPLNTRCGQRSLCDGCVIELLDGSLTNMATGETVTGTGQALRGCEYRLAHAGQVTIRIPARSLLAYEPQVVSEFKINVPHAHDPLWQQVTIPADGIESLQRRRPVKLACHPEFIEGSHPGTAEMVAAHSSGVSSNSARQAQHDKPEKGFATLEYRDDHWLVTGVAAEPDRQPLGVAVDIGTTTVALLVCDLRDGRVLAGAANFNRQMHLGDDVLTRINLCSTDPTQLRHLQDLIIEETLKPLLNEALGKAGATLAQVRCMTVAGNTTMLHLFAGVDPSPMGLAPFTATFLEHRLVTIPGWLFTIHLLPGAAAYVGADLTAGAFATGLVYDEGPSLLVDVGTNGEIILKRGNNLSGCATAAGPAFEGAGMTNGVRATDGAIAHIKLASKPFAVAIEKIGEGTPIGLCGTAYVDLLAEGRATDLLNERGRFVEAFAKQTMPWKDYGRALRVAT
ncbi:MAG: ASKHA domain-containing protein, partial [Verrucomicrobiota bacterium]